MTRRLRAQVVAHDVLASSAESGVRASVPHPYVEPLVIESDLPPPFTPRPVDRDAGRYFSSNPPVAKLNVLVVEDDEDLRGAIHQVVTQGGHSAVSATNLTEARVYLAVAMPEVMILDLNLEGEFGGDLLAELAALKTAPATVIVSAYPFAGLVADRYGVELVRKPFGLDELDAAIDRARQQRRRPRETKIAPANR